jgi:hypothetical protein
VGGDKIGGSDVFTNVARVVAVLAVGLTVSTPVVGEDDDFPIAGVYAKDQICKGDGSDQADTLVRITGKEIESNMGSCAILTKTRNGRTIDVQVECKVPGDQTILGDVTFKLRDDKTLDFDDQDHTSPAVLHKCGK